MAHGVIAACAVIGIISNILTLVIAFIFFYSHRKAITSLFNRRAFTSADSNQSRRDASQDTQLQEVVVQPHRTRAASTREVRVDIDQQPTFAPTLRSTNVVTEASVERISEQTIELDDIPISTIDVASADDLHSEAYDAYVDRAFTEASTHLQEIMVDPAMDVTSSSGEATISAGSNSPISESGESHSTVVLLRTTELPSLRFSEVFSGAVLDKMHLDGQRQAFMPYQESFKHFSVNEETLIGSEPIPFTPTEANDQYEVLNYTADLPEEALRHVNICHPAYDNDAYLEMDDDKDESAHHVHDRSLTVPSICYFAPPEDYEDYDNLAYVPDVPQTPVDTSPITSNMDDKFESCESLESFDVLSHTPDLPIEPLSMFVEARRFSVTSEESEEGTRSFEVVDETHHARHIFLDEVSESQLEASIHTGQAGSVTSEETDIFLRSYDVVPDHDIYDYPPASDQIEVLEILSYTPDLLQSPYIPTFEEPLIDFSDTEIQHVEVASSSSSYFEDYEMLAYNPDLPFEEFSPVVNELLIDFNVSTHEPVYSSEDDLEEDEILEYEPDIPEVQLSLYVNVVPSLPYRLAEPIDAGTEDTYHPRIINHPIRIVSAPYQEHTHVHLDHSEQTVSTLSFTPDLPSIPYHQAFHIYRERDSGVEHLIGSSPYPDIESMTVIEAASPLEQIQVEILPYSSDLPSVPYHQESRDEEIVELPTENHLVDSVPYFYENTLHKETEDHLITDEFTQRVSVLDPISEESHEHFIESSTYSTDATNEKVRLQVADILEEAAMERPKVVPLFFDGKEREEVLQTNPISSFVLDQMALQDDFMRRYNELLKSSFSFRFNSEFESPLPNLTTDMNRATTPPASNSSVEKQSEHNSNTPEREITNSDNLIEELTRRNASFRGEIQSSSYVDDIQMNHPPVQFIKFGPPGAFDHLIQRKQYQFGTGATPEPSTPPSNTTVPHQPVDINDMFSSLRPSLNNTRSSSSTEPTSNKESAIPKNDFTSTYTAPTYSFGTGASINQSSQGIGQGAIVSISQPRTLETVREDDSPPLNFSSFQWHSDTLQALYNKELNSDVHDPPSPESTLRRRR